MLSCILAGLSLSSLATAGLPSELPLDGRARGIVDLQAKCLKDNYMKATAKFAGGGCPDYVGGIQAMIEWSDAEPQPGVYDFSAIEGRLEQIAALGKFAVIKLNAGHKPAWMYEQIPYSEEIWSAENFDNATLMYWHPLHISSYLSLIDAYAQYVSSMDRKYGGLVAYVRMNFDAVGTEHIGLCKDCPAKDMSTWISPPGCASDCSAVDLPWSKERDEDYRQRVVDRHMSSFGSLRKLLLRANVGERVGGLDPLDLSNYEPFFKNASAGFFHTGAGMEENQIFNQTWRYSMFRKWSLPGTTFGFAEQAGFWQYTARWPLDPSDPNVGVFTKIQFAYWMMLSNLHNGVSSTGLHFDPMMFSPQHAGEVDRAPLNDTRYIDAYSFFASYAGYHAHPASSPGAWIAFRGQGDNFQAGDYSFLMDSVSAPSSFEEGRTRLGPDTSAYGAWCKALPAGKLVHLKAHLAPGDDGDVSRVLFRVVWLDACTTPVGGATWRLRYAAADGTMRTAVQVTVGNSEEWKETIVEVQDAAIGAASDKSSDLALQSNGAEGSEVAFHMVEVTRLTTSGPASLLV